VIDVIVDWSGLVTMVVAVICAINLIKHSFDKPNSGKGEALVKHSSLVYTLGSTAALLFVTSLFGVFTFLEVDADVFLYPLRLLSIIALYSSVKLLIK